MQGGAFLDVLYWWRMAGGVREVIYVDRCDGLRGLLPRS